MRKFYSLVAAAFLFAASNASAEVIYSWESAGPDAVTEVGGKASYANNDETKPNRVNYANTVGEKTYYTLCLNGKKGNMDDAASDNASYIKIELDQAVAADDKIVLTAYYNKGEEKVVTAYVRFVDASGAKMAEVSEPDDATYPDLGGAGTAPEVHTIAVPAEAAGSKELRFSRSKAGTNLFISKLEITRGSTGGVETIVVEDENAPMYNLQGVQVDENYKGVVIKNGKKFINK